MAEQEIANHSKKVIHLLGSREHGLLHTLRELALEIVTIVFAVSISIWFHGLSEHREEQKQVRSFLVGLKHDLERDVAQIKQISDSDRAADANYAYLAALDAHAAPEPEKFEAAVQLADANFFFIPERSRFDGFKSSGKLGNIENEALLNRILLLYQSTFAQIQSSERGWSARQEKWRAYLDGGLDAGDDTAVHVRLALAPRGKKLLKNLVANPQLYQRYQAYIEQSQKIIETIGEEYPAQVSAAAEQGEAGHST
jgi:hypothetical protein